MWLSHRPRRSVRRATATAAAVLGAVAVSGCDAPSPSATPGVGDRQVTVVGEGQVSGSPDTLTASVAVEFTAADVTAAMNQAGSRAQAIIDALTTAGVDRADIATTDVELVPVYGGSDPDGSPIAGTAAAAPTIVGYRATNGMDVDIRDVRDASQVLALVVTSGGDATRINSVRYSIDNDSQLVRDARERAFADAQARAEQYAQLSQTTLGPVISLSEAAGSAPLPQRGPAVAAASVPLEPGTQTVSFSVTAVWQLV